MNEAWVLETAGDILQLDGETLRLLSFRSLKAPGHEFIDASESHPVFVLGYLDGNRRYGQLDSNAAGSVRTSSAGEGRWRILTAVFSDFAGLDLSLTCTVRASIEDRFARWGIALTNGAGLEVVDLQYPFVVCTRPDPDAPGSESVLLPHGYGSGRLVEGHGPASGSDALHRKLPKDDACVWEFCSRTGDANHYPGLQFAQFLAYFDGTAGLYFACEDKDAHVKRFLATGRGHGVRLGVAHVGDWPAPGERTLGYETVARTFSGDWYDVADIYREWSLSQSWHTPLHRRTDIPAWLLDSPVYLTIRPQGVLDTGPVLPVEEFLPLGKCIPLLEKVADTVEAPLVVVLMGWERAGSWVFPDAFPPIGGEEGMAVFVDAVRRHGWQAGTFCSGTRWAVAHMGSGYDGREYFERNHGEECVCREADGSPWAENWDMDWRPSFACCVGAGETRRITTEAVKHLMDWGMTSLQFLDQNNGAASFPCFSAEHGHPPAPGRWMADGMARLMEDFQDAAASDGRTDVVHSAEAGLNETCLQLFGLTELRTFPPGYDVDVVPLYQYLFHECIVLQGMMGHAPEPFHLAIRNAVNCVLGGLPGGVLTGDGTLLDKDTDNWAPWLPHVEKSEDAFEMIRTVAALRRGPGRPYLVFGRMLRPAETTGIETMVWTSNGRENWIPAVFHSAWQGSDGRVGVVFANWTSSEQSLVVYDGRLTDGGAPVTVHLSGRTLDRQESLPDSGRITLTLPPHSCAVLEKGGNRHD